MDFFEDLILGYGILRTFLDQEDDDRDDDDDDNGRRDGRHKYGEDDKWFISCTLKNKVQFNLTYTH